MDEPIGVSHNNVLSKEEEEKVKNKLMNRLNIPWAYKDIVPKFQEKFLVKYPTKLQEALKFFFLYSNEEDVDISEKIKNKILEIDGIECIEYAIARITFAYNYGKFLEDHAAVFGHFSEFLYSSLADSFDYDEELLNVLRQYSKSSS